MRTTNTTNVQLWEKTQKAAQTFHVTYLGDGYYKLIDTNSKKNLDVQGAGVVTGTNVQIYEDNGNNAQRWIIKSAGNGYYYIISKSTGHYLDVSQAKTTNGTNIQVWYKNGNAAQKWKSVKVKSSNTITASNITKKASSKAQTFSLGAKAKGGAKLSYSSNNKKITVNSSGKVTIAKNYSGTAKITITTAATSAYNKTTKTITVTVNKSAQPMTVKAAKTSVSYSKTKNQTIKLTVSKAQGKVTYKSSNKYVTVSSGKITVKKKAPKQKYTITVTVAGNSLYKSGSKTITITVK